MIQYSSNSHCFYSKTSQLFHHNKALRSTKILQKIVLTWGGEDTSINSYTTVKKQPDHETTYPNYLKSLEVSQQQWYPKQNHKRLQSPIIRQSLYSSIFPWIKLTYDEICFQVSLKTVIKQADFMIEESCWTTLKFKSWRILDNNKIIHKIVQEQAQMRNQLQSGKKRRAKSNTHSNDFDIKKSTVSRI